MRVLVKLLVELVWVVIFMNQLTRSREMPASLLYLVSRVVFSAYLVAVRAVSATNTSMHNDSDKGLLGCEQRWLFRVRPAVKVRGSLVLLGHVQLHRQVVTVQTFA